MFVPHVPKGGKAGAGQVRITSRRPPANRLYDQGVGPPKIVGGFAGWEEIDVADGANLTEHAGYESLKIDVPILLDGFEDGKGQDKKLENLLRFGRDLKKDNPPPVVQVYAPNMPAGRNGSHFVVIDFTFDDEPETIYSKRGVLLRQHITVHLSEFNRPDTIRPFRRKRRGRGRNGGVIHNDEISGLDTGGVHTGDLVAGLRKRYTVRKGDTLIKIAMKIYQDRDMWKPLAKLNDIRDPRKELTPGRVIRLLG